MDDKDNNQIIDFSNQPLGLMAQEGSKIEENLNNEYLNNEAKRMGNNQLSNVSQDNPFAQINPPSTVPPTVVMNLPIIENSRDVAVTNFTSAMPKAFSNGVAELSELPTTPPTTPIDSANPLNQIIGVSPTANDNNSNDFNNNLMENNIQMSTDKGADLLDAEKQRKEEMMKELMGSSKNTQVPPDEQTSPLGVLIFLILVALVIGAFILFKTGKIDDLFEKKDADVVSTDNSTGNPSSEENNPVEPVEQPSEEIKTYRIKETSFLAAGETMTITSTGDVDCENNVSYLIMTVNYRGLTSRNLENYVDYTKGISYSYLDINGYNGWYYDSVNKKSVSLDETLKHIQSLGTPQEVSKDNYKIVLAKKDILNLLDNKSGYYNLNKLISGNAVVEYSLENGRLKKIRYDLSNASKDYNKFIIQQDFSDYNVPKSITIPDKVINSAKQYK